MFYLCARRWVVARQCYLLYVWQLSEARESTLIKLCRCCADAKRKYTGYNRDCLYLIKAQTNWMSFIPGHVSLSISLFYWFTSDLVFMRGWVVVNPSYAWILNMHTFCRRIIQSDGRAFASEWLGEYGGVKRYSPRVLHGILNYGRFKMNGIFKYWAAARARDGQIRGWMSVHIGDEQKVNKI